MSDVAAFVASTQADAVFSDALKYHEVLPSRPASFAPEFPDGYGRFAPLLASRGIHALYGHQARAIEAVENGVDVVLATPTASGKTLVYNLPVLRSALENRDTCSLYLFPLKALSQDQRRRLEEDAAAVGRLDLRVAVYDGDTPRATRQRLRNDPPSVLITTPDMLHAGILPHHATWRHFFERLHLVVLDELHTYRGIFGSHVAQVLRRLDRVAEFHGARPTFVAASATIDNPGELAKSLTGRDFEVVQSNDAPRSERHVLLFKPVASPYTLAARLFRSSLAQGLRTIAFTKARVITELMHTWIVEAEPSLASHVSSYRAGFLPSERREIERRLFSGELRGVISTSALEMGIDVGGLDVCILVGYPGSQVATWQRSGRVGRSGDAAIVLIAQPDALDQYLVAHPRVFLDRPLERAVLDPHNAEIAAAHLPCAAAELPLRRTESWLADAATRKNIATLEETGALLRSASGNEWFTSRRRPHRDVSLRQIGASYAITAAGDGTDSPTLVGSIGASNAFAECHEGAIYLHRGRQYLVTALDLDERTVHVRAIDAPFYTRALSEKETEILSRERSRPAGNFRVTQGRLKVTTRITGYERRRVRGQDLLSTERLELPPTSFETIGIWLEFPDEIPAALEIDGRHVMGGIHAVEHAALSLFPLFALCDRHDVGGISYVRQPQLGKAAFFLYDGHPGGVGITASLFDRVEALLEATLETIGGCDCEDGCPACVHSPKCGSGNRPIDKTAAVRILRLLLAVDPLPEIASPRSAGAPEQKAESIEPDEPHDRRRVVYFDIETQRSAKEVGGWHNAQLMRVAIAVLYDESTDRFETFGEGEVSLLIERLKAADLVVGFNVRRFDYSVLRGYTDFDFSELPTFDMLDAIHSVLGFRLPLGHLAHETLGAEKGADGLQSLQWWKEGRIDRIEAYCRQDVALLRDLLHHAEEHGHLFFRTREGQRVRLPARWSIDALIDEARARAARPAPASAGFPAQRSLAP